MSGHCGLDRPPESLKTGPSVGLFRALADVFLLFSSPRSLDQRLNPRS